ncbi:MAG: tRNA preQ1(34) S-adenosylmethionine ribosyltransferase-isomerase QueA [Candidatus Omnitrophota bacterium]
MKITDFDYRLPQELIAQFPAKRRDESRLLIIERKTGRIKHGWFRDIAGMFTSADVLVLNDTKVKPVRLIGDIEDKVIDILLVERIKKNVYFIKAKPGKKLKPKTIIRFAENKYSAVAVESDDARGQGMKLIEFKGELDIESVLDEIGVMPLPPYIKREIVAADCARYQTVYAKSPGAIAAPTAGLHFTEQILDQIKEKNTGIVQLTLHVGLGTFLPVKVEDIRGHKMHKESFELSPKTAVEIERVKHSGGRICAVGTTAARVLETCAGEEESFSLKPGKGQTDLFIYPPYKFKAVNMLLTNFHLPKTTLLMLVCAFASRELVLEAYKMAVDEKYRFFSYGDAMLII